MESLEDRIRRMVREDVALTPYDSRWPELFEREKAHLLSCLPNELVRRNRVAYTRGKTEFVTAMTERAKARRRRA